VEAMAKKPFSVASYQYRVLTSHHRWLQIGRQDSGVISYV
jgi:hypothetical protein